MIEPVYDLRQIVNVNFLFIHHSRTRTKQQRSNCLVFIDFIQTTNYKSNKLLTMMNLILIWHKLKLTQIWATTWRWCYLFLMCGVRCKKHVRQRISKTHTHPHTRLQNYFCHLFVSTLVSVRWLVSLFIFSIKKVKKN